LGGYSPTTGDRDGSGVSASPTAPSFAAYVTAEGYTQDESLESVMEQMEVYLYITDDLRFRMALGNQPNPILLQRIETPPHCAYYPSPPGFPHVSIWQ